MKGIVAMSFVTGLIELWLAGQAISASRGHISRLMKSVASILFLVVVSAIFGLMLIGCVYVIAYMTMTANGLTPLVSLLILLAVTVLALSISVYMACMRWDRLSIMSERMANDNSSVPDVGKKLVNAFLDGFKAQKTNSGAS